MYACVWRCVFGCPHLSRQSSNEAPIAELGWLDSEELRVQHVTWGWVVRKYGSIHSIATEQRCRNMDHDQDHYQNVCTVKWTPLYLFNPFALNWSDNRFLRRFLHSGFSHITHSKRCSSFIMPWMFCRQFDFEYPISSRTVSPFYSTAPFVNGGKAGESLISLTVNDNYLND